MDEANLRRKEKDKVLIKKLRNKERFSKRKETKENIGIQKTGINEKTKRKETQKAFWKRK